MESLRGAATDAAGHLSDLANCAKEVVRCISEGKLVEASNLAYYMGRAAHETSEQLRDALAKQETGDPR